MWLSSSIIYWSSLGFVAYTYAGYPALMQLASRLRPRDPVRGTATPSVTIVCAVHNEDGTIGAKLDNLLGLDYPRDRVQIIVVSDGSTDRTDDIVRGFSDRGVELLRVAQRSGKPTALNRGVAAAQGDLVLFCDARQRIDPGALRALAAPFADEQVGAVSGELHMGGEQGPGLYWRYEKLIRAAEGRFDSVVGATGALYAIRRHLWRELPADILLDDVYTPMQIALRGYRVLFEPAARVHDREASIAGEFARKARTLAGNYQLLRQLPALLHPGKNRLFWQFASHKVARLLCPFALLSLLGSNLVLVATAAPGWPLYALTLTGQLALYGAAAKRALSPRNAGPLARTSYTFVALNLAAIEGLRRFLRNDLAWTTAGPGA